MKLYHFAISFVIIAITSIIISDIRMDNLKAVWSDKEKMDRYLDTAIDDAVIKLVEIGENNQIIINKEKALESFHASLYSSFGILSDKDKQEELDRYLPVIAVTMEDGYYIYAYFEYEGEEEHSYVTRKWTEKLPYYYEDNDFVYGFTLGENITLLDKKGILDSGDQQTVYRLNYKDMKIKFPAYFAASNHSKDHFLLDPDKFELTRKGTIQSLIEQSMAYYTSHHNKIASEYGITYNFALPPIQDEQWLPYLDDPGFFVVFQGYPYGAGEVYNRFASSGAKVTKDKVFYLEQVKWYLIYHRSGCDHRKEDGILFDNQPYLTMEECVRQGAYGCPVCCPNDIHAPEYDPYDKSSGREK